MKLNFLVIKQLNLTDYHFPQFAALQNQHEHPFLETPSIVLEAYLRRYDQSVLPHESKRSVPAVSVSLI